MSLVLKKIPTTTVDVPVKVPGEEGTVTIQATWTLHKWDKYRDVVEASRQPGFKDEELLEDLKGLGGIKGEDGTDLPFNEELVETVMQETYIRRPLILSWFAAQEGRNQAAAKN